MDTVPAVRHEARTGTRPEFDAVVIGAGVAGLYQLYRLRELGLRVRAFEAGSAVGGTWYWNRYPGARFDSESWTYGYSFSKELLDEWEWEEHFSAQPHTERYLNYVADKFDLRRDIQFNSRVAAAHYREETRSWEIVLESGARHSTRFLSPRSAFSRRPTMPTIPGIESFKGQSCHTQRWPKDGIDFAGKRVGIIGTGATAVQTIQDDRQDRRSPDRVPAHPELVRSAAQRQDFPGGDARHTRPLSRNPGALPHDTQLLHPWPGSAQDARGDTRGTRSLLGKAAMRTPGFGLWQGEFQRHADRPRGQRARLRICRAQDPRAGP